MAVQVPPGTYYDVITNGGSHVYLSVYNDLVTVDPIAMLNAIKAEVVRQGLTITSTTMIDEVLTAL